MSTNTIDSLPTELLTQCLTHLDASSLSTMLSVSSRLRVLAAQDILWEPQCEIIYNKGSSESLGWRKVHKPELLPNGYEVPDLSYHLIWRRLRLCEDYLGWWLSLGEAPAGIVMRIWLKNDTLVISHAIPRRDTPVFAGVGGHGFALSWNNNSQDPVLIDSDSIIIEEYSVKSVRWLSEGPSSVLYHKHALRTFHTSDCSSAPSSNATTSETQSPIYNWPSHHSPSLFAAIRHSGIMVDGKGYASATGVPTVAFPRPPGPRPFVALQSPFELSSDSTLIEDGTWLASYGHAHGCEFIYIQIRHISEDDLSRPWGAEQNLARAFTPELRDPRKLFGLEDISPSDLTDEDMRIGDRIIEAIKITGDPNVPRGVRTFVGFLDHKSSWSGPRENDEFVARPTSHPWPIHPESIIQSAMPATALPAALAEMKEHDVPARGMTVPGLMRVADTGFVDPKWANAVIHITSRREVRVMIQDGHHVTTFYKVDKEMFHHIR